MRKKIFISLCVVIGGIYIILAAIFLHAYLKKKNMPQEMYKTVCLSLEGERFIADIADTEVLRAQGLSDRASSDRQNMLFVFDSPVTEGFWMKDMKFSLDLIWFDTSSVVVDIKRNATPESYPEIFYPQVPAQYVLETPTGVLKNLDTVRGKKFSFCDEKTDNL